MQKKRVKIISLLCAVLMVVSLAEGSNAASSKDTVTSQIEDYEKQIAALRESSKEISEKLYFAQEQLLDEREQKELLDEQCEILTQQINLIEENVAEVQKRIDENEALEEQQLTLFKKRVRMEEENGSSSYFNVLFNATSLADFISRVEFMTELAEYNNQIVNELRETRAQLEQDKERVREGEEELEAARNELNQEIEKENQLISEYLSTQEDLQAEYDMLLAEEESTTELLRQATEVAVQLGISDVVSSHGGYIWPTASVRTISSAFGLRESPAGIGSTNHLGIDLATPQDTKVMAAKAGYVTYAGWNGGYGNCVIIQHGSGNTTIYGHLNTITTTVGAFVLQGETIAYSGNTGTSTGPHLHFGIMEDGSWIDPTSYLS